MGSGLAAHFGAARLLYGMGRETLCRVGFGCDQPAIDHPPEQRPPECGAELLNFGVFIAFMGVNLAALVCYKFRASESEEVLQPALIPLLGFPVSAASSGSISPASPSWKLAWIALGLLVYFLMRRTKRPHPLPVRESE